MHERSSNRIFSVRFTGCAVGQCVAYCAQMDSWQLHRTDEAGYFCTYTALKGTLCRYLRVISPDNFVAK